MPWAWVIRQSANTEEGIVTRDTVKHWGEGGGASFAWHRWITQQSVESKVGLEPYSEKQYDTMCRFAEQLAEEFFLQTDAALTLAADRDLWKQKAEVMELRARSAEKIAGL